MIGVKIFERMVLFLNGVLGGYGVNVWPGLEVGARKRRGNHRSAVIAQIVVHAAGFGLRVAGALGDKQQRLSIIDSQ